MKVLLYKVAGRQSRGTGTGTAALLYIDDVQQPLPPRTGMASRFNGREHHVHRDIRVKSWF